MTLCAQVESAGPLDAIVLRAGGRRWITSHFAAALERLASEVAPGPGTKPSRRQGSSGLGIDDARPSGAGWRGA